LTHKLTATQMCVISAVVNISKPVWHKYGTQGNEWKKGMYYMDPSNSIAGYVVFEATHGNGVFGDIALLASPMACALRHTVMKLPI